MVEVNRESLSKLPEKEQSITCAICMDDVEITKETRLDSCSHKYCFDCIQKWVDDVENTCP